MDDFKDSSLALWQVQISHNAQRDLTFKLGDSFEEYLVEKHKTNKKDLERLGIRLSLGDAKDPDGVGPAFFPYYLLSSPHILSAERFRPLALCVLHRRRSGELHESPRRLVPA